jgi:hypothetical protein
VEEPRIASLADEVAHPVVIGSATSCGRHGSWSTWSGKEASGGNSDFLSDFERVAFACAKVQKVLVRSWHVALALHENATTRGRLCRKVGEASAQDATRHEPVQLVEHELRQGVPISLVGPLLLEGQRTVSRRAAALRPSKCCAKGGKPDQGWASREFLDARRIV